jgi:uncharacterized membrane protein
LILSFSRTSKAQKPNADEIKFLGNNNKTDYYSIRWLAVKRLSHVPEILALKNSILNLVVARAL